MKKRRASGMMASPALVLTFAASAPAVASPTLPSHDAIVIAEAYHLWQSLGEDVWPGWTHVSMPMVYVTAEHEFAIGFAGVLDGFTPTADRVVDRNIQVRSRDFDARVAAAMDFQDIPAVVLGTPHALEWSPTQWTLKATHEMFHVLSMQRGSAAKIRALEIGPEDDASWQLDFPFPYDDIDVMRLLHLQGYPMFLAITAPDGDESIGYKAGTLLEAVEVLKSVLRDRTGDDRAAKYAMFQETEEGAGRYTEYRMAQLAATGHEPLVAFRELDDFTPFATTWEQEYRSAPFVIKHAGRAVKTRTVFYYTGLGKCLLLDRIKPDWKYAYFTPGVWLDDLIAQGVGGRTTLAPIKEGAIAPAFELDSLRNEVVRLADLRGKVVLLDFWQWWCPPCVKAMPHLQALQDKYADMGLVVVGVSDRVDEVARTRMVKAMGDGGATYPALIDPNSDLMRAYGVNSYPMLVLVDRDGRVGLVHVGFASGDERELEEAVERALAD